MLKESVKIKDVKLQIGQLTKVLRKKNKLSGSTSFLREYF